MAVRRGAKLVRGELRQLGRTSLKLPSFGFGGAGVMLGGRDPKPSRADSGFLFPGDADADSTLSAAWDGGVRYYDTAPWYGLGQSEHRIGRFLYDRQPRDSFVMSTKVGRLLRRPADRTRSRDEPGPPSRFKALGPWPTTWPGGLQFDHIHDYTYDGVMRSYEDSLQRTGMGNGFDALTIHDLDLMHFTPAQLEYHMGNLFTSGWRALYELKHSGEIKAFGAGVNHGGTMTRFLETMELDYFLVSQIYTLVHHGDSERFGQPTTNCPKRGGSGLAELDAANEAGVGVIAATPFASGILATAGQVPVCNYRPATDQELKRVKRIDKICRERHGVPSQAAALQFALGHPAVATIIGGMGSADEARQTVAWAETQVPDALWDDLRVEGLIDENAPTPISD